MKEDGYSVISILLSHKEARCIDVFCDAWAEQALSRVDFKPIFFNVTVYIVKRTSTDNSSKLEEIALKRMKKRLRHYNALKVVSKRINAKQSQYYKVCYKIMAEHN